MNPLILEHTTTPMENGSTTHIRITDLNALDIDGDSQISLINNQIGIGTNFHSEEHISLMKEAPLNINESNEDEKFGDPIITNFNKFLSSAKVTEVSMNIMQMDKVPMVVSSHYMAYPLAKGRVRVISLYHGKSVLLKAPRPPGRIVHLTYNPCETVDTKISVLLGQSSEHKIFIWTFNLHNEQMLNCFESSQFSTYTDISWVNNSEMSLVFADYDLHKISIADFDIKNKLLMNWRHFHIGKNMVAFAVGHKMLSFSAISHDAMTNKICIHYLLNDKLVKISSRICKLADDNIKYATQLNEVTVLFISGCYITISHPNFVNQFLLPPLLCCSKGSYHWILKDDKLGWYIFHANSDLNSITIFEYYKSQNEIIRYGVLPYFLGERLQQIWPQKSARKENSKYIEIYCKTNCDCMILYLSSNDMDNIIRKTLKSESVLNDTLAIQALDVKANPEDTHTDPIAETGLASVDLLKKKLIVEEEISCCGNDSNSNTTIDFQEKHIQAVMEKTVDLIETLLTDAFKAARKCEEDNLEPSSIVANAVDGIDKIDIAVSTKLIRDAISSEISSHLQRFDEKLNLLDVSISSLKADNINEKLDKILTFTTTFKEECAKFYFSFLSKLDMIIEAVPVTKMIAQKISRLSNELEPRLKSFFTQTMHKNSERIYYYKVLR